MLECKLIKGFCDYIIFNDGEVYSRKTQNTMKPTSNRSGKGYMYVDLYVRNRRTRKYIHRLVAEAFIPNPDGKPYVNHIDGDPKNNAVENLEWCTPLENVEHASKIIKTMDQYTLANERRKRRIKMLDKYSGFEVATFESIRDAERKTGIPSSNIVDCLKGKQKYTKAFSWCYAEELEDNK